MHSLCVGRHRQKKIVFGDAHTRFINCLQIKLFIETPLVRAVINDVVCIIHLCVCVGLNVRVCLVGLVG